MIYYLNKKVSIKMKIKLLTTLALTAFLIGCNDTPEEKIKTVDYYEQNEDSLKLKVQECKNNPGELREDPNCHNAFQAMRNNSSGVPSNNNWGEKAAENYIKKNISE